MGLFKKRDREPELPPAPAPPAAVAGLPQVGDTISASLAAHSEFIKRATCSRCGGPKTLPSTTAYLYCDFCGALVDYDFRIANAETNAGLTNTVYHRLIAPLQDGLAQAKATGDRDTYCRLQTEVFEQWIDLCPQAVSPRAKTDLDFRARMVAYLVETTVTKDMDQQQQLDIQMGTLIGSLQRIGQPDGAWMVHDDFWPMAALFKQQMELAYALIEQTGVAATDPDDAPPGVAVRMEYSTFCQGWLPHLSADEGARLLAEFGLTGDYTKVVAQPTETHQCGNCGSDLRSVIGARVIVCESCGHQIDIQGGAGRGGAVSQLRSTAVLPGLGQPVELPLLQVRDRPGLGSRQPTDDDRARLASERKRGMAQRHEELNPAEVALQQGLDRSWAYAQRALADPESRSALERSIERVNRSAAMPMSTSKFLAQTESLFE